MIRYETGPAPDFFSTAKAREHNATAKRYFLELSRSRYGLAVGLDARGPGHTIPFVRAASEEWLRRGVNKCAYCEQLSS
jgi:hypothetical protein